jgi:hypothetical protein
MGIVKGERGKTGQVTVTATAQGLTKGQAIITVK